MGDRFRKQQIKNFQKGRDRAIEEAAKPKLFERPEAFKTIFTVQPIPGEECRVGEQLRVLMDDPDGPVHVVRGYQKIGLIEGDAGTELRIAASNPQGPNVAELKIIRVSALEGDAQAEVVNTFAN